MRNSINLTNEQIENLFDEAFDAFVALDGDYATNNVAFTADTLDHFIEASKNYNECFYNPELGEVGGFKTLVMKKCQVRKGDQRKDVCVIDFGEVRAVVLS